MAQQLEAKLNDTDVVISNVKNELKDQLSVLRVRQFCNNLERIKTSGYRVFSKDCRKSKCSTSDDSDR